MYGLVSITVASSALPKSVHLADVYERLTPKGSRAPFYVMLITQTVSAVWHGLFPGYGMFFITSAFMFEASKVIFRYERAYAPSKTFPGQTVILGVWAAIKWAFTAFILNYAAAAFLVSISWYLWLGSACYIRLHCQGEVLKLLNR